MEQKVINIKIKVDKSDTTKNALNLRYIVSDTIEERQLGEVIDESIGLDENDIEISALIMPDLGTVEEIKSVLDSLGLSNQYSFSFEE